VADDGNAPERLRRIPGGHSCRYTVRFTDEENECLAADARACGVSIPRLLAERGLAPGGGGMPVGDRRAMARGLGSCARSAAISTGSPPW
jgi:hypothetical protein